MSEQQQDGAAGRLRAAHARRAEHGRATADYDDDDVAAVLDERDRLAKLLGIGIDREQWDAIAETEGRRYESEQTDDTLVGYLAYQRESSRVLSRHLQREVKELEAERDALAARIAELDGDLLGLRGTELNPSLTILNAQDYESLRDEIAATMTDDWDGDEAESWILAQYVRWLAAGQPRDEDGYPIRRETYPPADRIAAQAGDETDGSGT